MYKLSDIAYETPSGRFWILTTEGGHFEIYRVDGTHSVKMNPKGRVRTPIRDLSCAKAEANRLESELFRRDY